ncbi:glycosyl transferase family 14 [Mucilaginibacter paludis]|uniref:Peptide O-xylosyltransferase n=1 Tax=Mucilaginibacter paludis DSM 18603 TaxID=714943 RepID=H1Y1N7_9SPHI|nr:glycosyl transferase family 14 [Mucilaginibacter paludis]EHQ24696.1 glycosyl transferase family 14 [Mucilaginibacter paludis DSM 18603]
MKVAYLIIAHKNFEHIIDIVTSLNDPKVSFLIHFDEKVKVDINEINRKLPQGADVYFLDARENVNWGGFSVLMAVLNLIQGALHLNCFDYIYLISGQDFPLKTSDEMIDFLEQNAGKEFIEYHTIPHSGWGGGQDRYEHFWMIDTLGMQASRNFIEDQRKQNFTRKFPNNLQPFGGSMWFTITAACAEYIIDHFMQYPDELMFFKYTLIPDELAIVTVIMNSIFKNQVVNNNLRHIDWSENRGRPKIMTVSDLVVLIKSESHFARKFDPSVDVEVINALKAKLNQGNEMRKR